MLQVPYVWFDVAATQCVATISTYEVRINALKRTL
jgi:hypothetical protein